MKQQHFVTKNQVTLKLKQNQKCLFSLQSGLEELKEYKEKPEGWMWDEAERKGYDKAYEELESKYWEKIYQTEKNIRNKVIDDLTNIILTEIKNGVGGNIEDFIKEIAEQLKAGDNNADSN